MGNAHLCDSCHWGQFITGYRESDRLAICTNTSPNIVLPFTVYACSNFSDKHKPDWEQMKKLAIDIRPVRVSKEDCWILDEDFTPAGNSHWRRRQTRRGSNHSLT